MANGDPFDMYGMTAAHKTLPLGCIIKITNLENERECIVEITDRGPYVERRFLDVSRGVAEMLGMVEQGVADVSIEVKAWRKEPR